jgi:phosphatidylinositol-3-phosphatase
VRSRDIAPIGLGLLFVGGAIVPGPQATAPTAPVQTAVGREAGASTSPHVVVIVLENREFFSIIGSSEAPFLNSLAEQYGLAERYFANTHPSLPNYLDLIAGRDFGIHDDGEEHVLRGRTLVNQLEANGLTWRAYMEGLARDRTAPCPFSSRRRYRKKHNPFAYVANIQGRSARCRNVFPYARLDRALATGPPNFTWITPNMCHDMHDCSIRTGDDWLASQVPRILGELSGQDLLFVVFDEGTTAEGGGGHVVCIVAGPGARPATSSEVPYSHFSLLKTIEQRFGLGFLRHAADPGVNEMTDLLLPAA